MNGAYARFWKLTALACSLATVCACTPAPQSTVVISPNGEESFKILELPRDFVGHQSAGLKSGFFIGMHSIGMRISTLGTQFSPFGQALPYFLADDWDASVEEKLVKRKGLFDLKPIGFGLVPERLTDYSQSRNLRTGEVITEFTTPTQGGSTKVVRTMRVAQDGIEISTRSTVLSGPPPVWKLEILGKQRDANEGSAELAPRHPYSPVTAVRWRQESTGDTHRLRLSFERKDNSPPNEYALPTIELDGPVEDQRAINSMLLGLYEGLRGTPAPMGLSSDLYFGHIFWDTDIWMFPVAALLMPDKAASIVSYRLERADQARKNFAEWCEAGRPIGTGSLGAYQPKAPGIKFPWESAATGKETVPGPSRFQDHITGSMLFGLHQGVMLGHLEERTFAQLAKEGLNFYLARSVPGLKSGDLAIKGTMSPDEHHTGDNDLYTNLLAERVARWAGRDDLQWTRPRDAQSLLNYEADRGKGYKQAAGVLAIYPLQDLEAESQAMTMLNRFAPVVIKTGPAMTDSVHATIEARFGDPEKALGTWRRSWRDFTDLPMSMFSEKRRGDRSYFLTGAGGCLQTVLYGFAGIRISETKTPGATPLRAGGFLSIDPNLPKDWRSLRISPLYLPDSAGKLKPFELTIEGDQAQLWPLNQSNPEPASARSQ